MSTRSQHLLNRILMVLGVALVVATGVVFVAHDGGPGESSTQPAAGSAKTGDAVPIKDFLYKPEAIEVAVGAKITFTNEDSAPHTATSDDDGGFDTGTLRKGESKDVSLTKAGTFAYLCTIHPFMKGTVTVK